MSAFLKTLAVTAAATGAVAFIWRAATASGPPEPETKWRETGEVEAEQLSEAERDLLLSELESQL